MHDPTRIPMGGVDKCLLCGWQGSPDEPHGCPRYRDEPPAASACVCGHTARWHSHDGTGDCEHDGECECRSFVAYPLRTAWVCVCGHRNTRFATACFGGCGRDLPETLDDATRQGIEVHL